HVARLALRQQNQRTLLPALLHEVNGSLNGLTLSTELLARVLPGPCAADVAQSHGGDAFADLTPDSLLSWCA
ncbi:MAG: hypothetical protein H7A14_09620, partial [Sinobacteraceae bacterium]|nr:hypothetical protein [Nevskiaceae bacterium]